MSLGSYLGTLHSLRFLALKDDPATLSRSIVHFNSGFGSRPLPANRPTECLLLHVDH